MSRCYICDWSPTTPSLYNEGLSISRFVHDTRNAEHPFHNPGAGDRKLLTDSEGRSVCSHCDHASFITSRDLQEQFEEVEETDLEIEEQLQEAA
jgi:hypothetical protein